MTPTISDSDIQTYRKQGAVRLRGVIDTDWLGLLAEGVEQTRAAPGKYAKEYAQDGRGSFFTDHHVFLRFDSFRRFLFEGPGPSIAAQLTGASRITLYDEHLLLKEPGTETPTYWHHDLPYFNIQGDQICSLWIPLDPVTEETGAMRFAIGSHLWGKLFMPIRIGAGDPVPGFSEDSEIAGPVPDIDSDPERYPTVCYELEPGDCVAFHGRTLHAAGGNASSSVRRRAVSHRFCGDDITWKNRSSAPLVFETNLNDGDSIEREECPVVWPRPERGSAATTPA